GNRVEVRTYAVDDEVIFEVEDTGCGIPEELRHRLFDPFFTTKRPGDGTGLGLSICRSIVEGYRGTIEIDSEVGVGTTIRVRLPACIGDEARFEEPPPERHELATRRGRVLVVDDEQGILRALEAVFASEHEVVTASSAAEARAVIKRDGAFDIVLCDVVMSDGTGVDLYDFILTMRPLLAESVLFMTGGAITDETKAFLHRFVDRTLMKPVDPVAIRAHLARALAPSA